MFSRDASSTWLEALGADYESELAKRSLEYRMMYSTASFFDLAGYGITRSGACLSKSDPNGDWVYQFEPVEVECTSEGVTRWSPANGTSMRYLFRVVDCERYPGAMTTAMRALLTGAFGSGMDGAASNVANVSLASA
jgi:hypothetical protein